MPIKAVEYMLLFLVTLYKKYQISHNKQIRKIQRFNKLAQVSIIQAELYDDISRNLIQDMQIFSHI